MFLDIYSRYGKRYIRVSEGYRVEKDGVSVTRKRILKSLGPVSRYDDGKPNFETRLRDSFKACDPIIDELKPYVKFNLPKDIYHITIHAGTDECIGLPKLFATCIFDKLIDEIGLRAFVGSYKQFDKITYDVLGFIRLALYGRILNPASKISTTTQNDKYYIPILDENFYKFNIYDMLDFVSKHKNAIFNKIDTNMRRKFGRTTTKIFYDVTNFYFEIDNPDKKTNADGETEITGSRHYGVCKEERHLPITQMGLIMDEQGYPVSIETFNGNTLDHQTLITSFENSVDSLKNSRYIFVSDKGIGRGGNLKYAIAAGNGYVVSKTVRGSTKEDKKWMLEDNYTVVNKDYKLKSRIIEKNYELDDGTIIKSSEKQVVYWSRHFFDKQRAEKKKFYDFIEKLIESPDSFKITKIEAGLLGKYVKKKLLYTKTGELINSKDLKATVDYKKIEAEYKLLGYYTIITSETQMTNDEIIETYHNLVRIEDEFRTMKLTLETRPIYVRDKDHITAHLTLCVISLLLVRIIQNQIKKKNPSLPKNSYGLSAERIRKALNEWTVEKIADEYYRFNNIENADLKLILDAFGIEIPKKLYRIGELRHFKQTIKMSM